MAFITAALPNTEQLKLVVCRITVVFNNLPGSPRLQEGWGFACVVEGFERTVLFDTGGDGRKLLANMQELGFAPAAIDVVVLSHIHMDHTGGWEAFLARNPNVKVYTPRSFPQSFKKRIIEQGAEVIDVGEPMELFNRVHSTGEMGNEMKEQALILDTSKGLVVITGCAHPGVVYMVERAKQVMKKEVHQVIGGFHLMGSDPNQIPKHIRALRALGVNNVVPSHCTGQAAIARFQEVWDDDFLLGACGAVIEIAP